MRTSREVYHQLRWDPRFEPADYRLGYRDRSGRMKWVPLVDFVPEGDIPWHRVWLIEGPTGVVWDREARLDRVQPGAGRISPPSFLRVLTWNMMGQDFPLPEADIIALQEFSGAEGMIGTGSVWLRIPTPPVQVLLCQDRAVVVELDGGLRVAALHLTSDRQPRAADKRFVRMQEILALEPTLILGDLNASPRELDSWGLEGWQRALAGPTFDAESNPLTRSTSSRVVQLDHVLVRGMAVESCALVPGPGSDHYGLLARLTPSLELSRETALVVVPPREVWGPIQQLRRERDPGFARWMPHLTLRFPFVTDLAAEATRLQAVLRDFPPFSLRLDRMGSFGRVHWLGPSRSPELQELYRLVTPASGEFNPHLTVARGAAPPPLEPVEFTVESVHLLRRAGEAFVSEHSVALGRAQPPDWLRQACPGPLYLTGAAARGVPTEDEDWVWQGGPLEEAASRLGGRLALTAQVPRLLVRQVDLTAVESDTPLHRLDLAQRVRLQDTAASAVWDHEALRSLLDRRFLLPRARELWREVCAWARARQIYGQAFGYPGGLAWCLIVANALVRSREDVLAFAAEWPWPQPMSVQETDFRTSRPMAVLTPIEPFRNTCRAVFPATLQAILRALRDDPEPNWAHRLAIPFSEPSRLLALLVALDRSGVVLRPRPEKSRLVLDIGQDADLERVRERITQAGYASHFFF